MNLQKFITIVLLVITLWVVAIGTAYITGICAGSFFKGWRDASGFYHQKR